MGTPLVRRPGVPEDPSVPTIALELDALARLTEDIRAATWLLEDQSPLRAYLEMLGALPADPDAWEEVLAPWLDAARHGLGPRLEERGDLAAAGALGVAALRAARELPEGALAASMRAAARWCFFVVRPAAR